MPPIVSTLEADFSDFVIETQKANAALNDMQREFVETQNSADRGAVVVGKFGKTAQQSSSGFSTLSTGLRSADKMLAQFGVNIGSEIAALDELGQVAGKTASQIGLIGTAGALAAAGMLGWQLGSVVADLWTVDEAFGDLLVTMGLFKDPSEEAKKAVQATIERAQALDPTVRTLSQAIKVNERAVRDQSAAYTSSEARIAGWNRELKNAEADGLPGLRAEIERGVLTQKQLADRYNVSAEAVGYLTKEVNTQTQARKAHESAAKSERDALEEVQQALIGQEATLSGLDDETRSATEAALAAGVAQSTIAKAYHLTAAQVKAVAGAMKEAEEASKGFAEAQELADAANAKWNDEVLGRSATTTQALIADVERWRTEQLASLDANVHATEAHYATIEQIAGEKLAQIQVDWDVLKEGSLAHYADLAARAEATYQAMVGNSAAYSQQAIEHQRQVRDETAATFAAMQGGQSEALAAMLKREKGYADALTDFRKEAATAADVAFQKETADLDRLIAYSQTYGVTIDDAKRKLGMLGDEGEAAGQRTAAAMDGAKQQVGQLGAIVDQTSAQMRAMAQHYEELARENKQAMEGSAAFWSPWQLGTNYEESARKLREQAGRRAQYERGMGAGEGWARQNTLTVTVNNADAQNIAQRLVSEMRHAGVAFG